MGKEEPPKPEAFVAQRNFKIPVAEQLRALAAGPPSFARRLRKIEDLRAAVVGALADYLRDPTGEDGEEIPLDRDGLPVRVGRDLARLNKLIDDHNRYYPIEARLPIDLRTRQFLDWGEPWSPLPALTGEEIFALARAARREG
jgi:hypothetical protein